MRACWYHEDDYCQVELLPLASRPWCERQIGAIDQFADEHRSPDGAGFTSVYVRDPAPVPLRTLGLTPDGLAAILEPHLPEFDRVDIGYAPYAETAERTRGFGFAFDSALFLDHGEDGVVEHIWITVNEMEPAQARSFIAALAAVGERCPLLLTDWPSGVIVDLGGRSAVEEYFQRERE